MLRTAATRVVRCLAGAGRRHPGPDNSSHLEIRSSLTRPGEYQSISAQTTYNCAGELRNISRSPSKIFRKYARLIKRINAKDHGQINVVFQMYNFVFKTSLTSTCNVQKCFQTDIETERTADEDAH